MIRNIRQAVMLGVAAAIVFDLDDCAECAEPAPASNSYSDSARRRSTADQQPTTEQLAKLFEVMRMTRADAIDA